MHGKGSEKLNDDELQLAFEDSITAVDEAETRQDAEVGPRTPARRAARHNRGHLPASLLRVEQVIVTVRPKYACRRCGAGVSQAPPPAHLIVGGLLTKGALAHVLVSKYADHLLLYCQSQILARAGVELHRSTLADWVGTAAFHFGLVVD